MRPRRFRDATAFEAWLQKNHAKAGEVWLVIAKKGERGLSIGDALDVALCFGWIDGHRRSNDEASFLQRYSPRRPGSSWSKINVDKVAALTAAGRMRAAGMAQVEVAKADGRWAIAYVAQRDFVVPDDVRVALEANPRAASVFACESKSEQFTRVLPVLKAVGATTRAARSSRLVVGLSRAP
ncbi:MAG: OmdA domain containing protein [Archangium gephyra]|uniref:OmdA domain containing protein n=1 Tax=Archangium gephyra TaxID=48 RepID=A0A2W5TRB5_9BACT|nr:MAG: OmdA domain containing protein [Archangium gephyra]